MIELATILAQFGPAGLIGLLWIVERRHASSRERQLNEAHRKLAAQNGSLEALLAVVKDNTRAIVTLEQTQRQLIDLARALAQRAPAASAAPAGPAA